MVNLSTKSFPGAQFWLARERLGLMPRKMFCLKTYADYDDEQLTRAKGGVIAAQINGTKLEMVENIIMPVTDESRKRSRILYKSNKRKLSMRHLRNK